MSRPSSEAGTRDVVGPWVGGGEIAPGVRELEHTADLGVEVRAPSLEMLFHRAARGMMALIRGDGENETWEGAMRLDRGGERVAAGRGEEVSAACPPGAGRTGAVAPAPREREEIERGVDLEADDAAALMVAWLRELLYLHEVEDFSYRSSKFQRLDDRGLRARVRGGRDPVSAVRELKGVTYHGLEVRREDDEWIARLIFDI